MTSTDTCAAVHGRSAWIFPIQRLLLLFCLVIAYGSTNESLQRTLFYVIPFMDCNSSPLVAFKSGIEDFVRIAECGTVHEDELHLILEDISNTDDPVE